MTIYTVRSSYPFRSWRNKVVEYQLWPALDALGISRCGLHAFRHAVASMLHDLGYSVEIAEATPSFESPHNHGIHPHRLHERTDDRLAESLKLDADGRKTVPNPQYLQ